MNGSIDNSVSSLPKPNTILGIQNSLIGQITFLVICVGVEFVVDEDPIEPADIPPYLGQLKEENFEFEDSSVVDEIEQKISAFLQIQIQIGVPEPSPDEGPSRATSSSHQDTVDPLSSGISDLRDSSSGGQQGIPSSPSNSFLIFNLIIANCLKRDDPLYLLKL